MRQVIIKPDPDDPGFFNVSVPSLPGCHTQGKTVEEAVEMAKDAILCWLESAVAHGDPIPPDDLGIRLFVLEDPDLSHVKPERVGAKMPANAAA